MSKIATLINRGESPTNQHVFVGHPRSRGRTTAIYARPKVAHATPAALAIGLLLACAMPARHVVADPQTKSGTQAEHPVAELSGHADIELAFSRTGERLLVAGSEAFSVWGTENHHLVSGNVRTGKEGPIRAAAMSSDGKRVAIASRTSAEVWDVGTSKRLRSYPHRDRVNSIAFSPDGSTLVTAADDRLARIWDETTGKLILERKHPDGVQFATFSPDGTRILTVVTGNVDDGHLPNVKAAAFVWDARTGRMIGNSMGIDNPGDAARTRWNARVGFSSDSQRAFVVILGEAVVCDLGTGKMLARTRTDPDDHFGTVRAAAFSPDGKQLVTGGGEFNQGSITIWNAASGKLLRALSPATDSRDVLFSHDGKRVAAALASGDVKVWDSKTGKALLVVRYGLNAKPGSQSIAFNSDGSRLAIGGGKDGPTTIWQIEAAAKAGR